MTYEDAKKYKADLNTSPIQTIAKLPIGLYIVPSGHADLLLWLKEFDPKKTKDEDAKKFSSDNDYSIHIKSI